MNNVERRISEKGGPLYGVTSHTFNPTFVEMAGLMGFDVVWIEMEHGHITFAEAAMLCRIASGTGMLSMIRIADARRENVLKAAECGPDIIDLPMGNSVEIVEDLVRYARYLPDGNRGFFGVSRAMRYGISANLADEMRRINAELCLLSQIETREAVRCAEDLCLVPGLDGIFIGPGDLSLSMGMPGKVNDDEVQRIIEHCVRVAKSGGKLAAFPCLATEVSKWIDAGVDILFCAGEITLLKTGLKTALSAIEQRTA